MGKHVIDDLGHCPVCGISWVGEPIPLRYRRDYGGAKHFSRLVGVEYSWNSPNHYDGISEWQCPDCFARFGRWSGKLLAKGESEKPWGGQDDN